MPITTRSYCIVVAKSCTTLMLHEYTQHGKEPNTIWTSIMANISNRPVKVTGLVKDPPRCPSAWNTPLQIDLKRFVFWTVQLITYDKALGVRWFMSSPSCNYNRDIDTGFPSFITIPRLDFILLGLWSGFKSFYNSATWSRYEKRKSRWTSRFYGWSKRSKSNKMNR